LNVFIVQLLILKPDLEKNFYFKPFKRFLYLIHFGLDLAKEAVGLGHQVLEGLALFSQVCQLLSDFIGFTLGFLVFGSILIQLVSFIIDSLEFLLDFLIMIFKLLV